MAFVNPLTTSLITFIDIAIIWITQATIVGSVTMTTEVGTNGATTLSRMNFSGYVGHVTLFS